MAGLTDEGFTAKTEAEILADVEQRQKDAPEIGPAHDYSPEGALGQLNGTYAAEFAELWELAAAVYASKDPNKATGDAMIAIAAITGTTPRAASRTRVESAVVNLDAGVTLPAGSQAAVTGRPDLVFELEGDVTNPGGAPADVDAVFVALNDGPIACNAGTLEEIVTNVVGWNSVTNTEDGARGRNADGTIEIRARREAQLALRGSATARAIRADLLDSETTPELVDVLDVQVLENDTDYVDENGLPPHSVEAVIDDGDAPTVDNEILAEVIYGSVAAGIATHGIESADVTDSAGDLKEIRFSRVTRREVWIELEIEIGPGFPVDGIDQVKATVAEVGASTYTTGADVIALFVKGLPLRVAGVVDVPDFAIDFAAAPTAEDNLEVGPRERAVFDTSRITVTVL